jgi:hypothetical protein
MYKKTKCRCNIPTDRYNIVIGGNINMRKIISLIVTAVFILSVFSVIGTSIQLKSIVSNDDNFESFIISISYSDFEIVEDNGKHSIEMEGYNYLSEPGKPLIPSKNVLIALPPDSIVQSVDITGLNIRQVTGYYNILPASKVIPACSNMGYEEYFEDIDKKWNENYELAHSSDDAYPVTAGEIVNQGSYHKISYVSVSVYPFVYHPASGRLFKYDSAEIKLYYKNKEMGDLRYNSEIDKKASELFINYDSIKHMYQSYMVSSSSDNYNYVIISSRNLYDSIVTSDFIGWKTNLGFSIKIVDITDSLITSQQGVDLAEQIRNFLRSYYADWGINYVLIVGNYDNVPMRYCYPDPANHRFDPFDMLSGEVPTDYYYADLSSSDAESWDSDGDGFHGEFRDDDPDFLSEVSVGRIPTNDATRITYTLDKVVSFEQETGSWKNNALNAGAFFYFTNQDNSGDSAMDGAVLSYYIEEDIMDGWTISHYSEQEGLETSIYDWPALNEDAFISDWRNGQYSIVNWQGHGWTNRVTHCIWSSDDGDGIPESNELSWPDFINVNSDLDDGYPSIVTAVSCYVGCPELDGARNLGIDLLTNSLIGASVGVVASARSPYGSIGWSPSNPGGSDSIIYEFNKNMIVNHDKVGDALYNSKFYCNSNFGWDVFYEYIDIYTFNLYGDPSLVLQGINVEGKPNKPLTPSGPSNGKTREEYTYTTSTTDPEGDQIYYLFDWDDGTNSGWIGPYNSGEECSSSHTWNNRGSYHIKAKAKDENGGYSPWSDPLSISMPRNRAINRPFFYFFDNHPYLFPILQLLLQRLGL